MTYAPDPGVRKALSAGNSSTRLAAAMAAGTHPDPDLVEPLVARCAVEPVFFVRDMLTWALTRMPRADTVPRLLAELDSETAQARAQALHTLSKIGDVSTWPAITRALLHDAVDEVATSAWRAAVVLVDERDRAGLAADLAAELGRGDPNVQLSLSRSLIALPDVVEEALQPALASDDPAVRAHAQATRMLLHDPDKAFEPAVAEARRVAALGPQQDGEAAC